MPEWAITLLLSLLTCFGSGKKFCKCHMDCEMRSTADKKDSEDQGHTQEGHESPKESSKNADKED